MIAILFVPFMILGVLGVMWVLNNKSWKARQDPYGSREDGDTHEERVSKDTKAD